MFRVTTNLEQTITKKKKLLFISTLSSNETSSFKPKLFKNNKNQYQSNSKSSSLNEPLPAPKKNKKYFEKSNKNYNNHKILPMKRILFHLYRVNFMNSKKEKGKSQSQNKKENNYKKNGNYNLKHKQRHLPTKNNNISYNNKNYSAGRWKSDEHQRFIDAIIMYGNNWRQVQKYVGTRSSTQTRSHAQKFFEKLKRSKIFIREKYDFSKNSLKILHDIMKNLPDKEYNQKLKELHSLSYERNSNSENDKNTLQNNNGIINYNNTCNENNDNNFENYNNNNDGNNNVVVNNEENIKCIKFSNQGYCFLECNNNNKNYNNEDYLFYNNSNINNNNISNNLLIKDFLNYDYKSYGRKESDIFSQRENSLSDMNLNIKDLKEQNFNNNNNNNINMNQMNPMYQAHLMMQMNKMMNTNFNVNLQNQMLQFNNMINSNPMFLMLYNQMMMNMMNMQKQNLSNQQVNVIFLNNALNGRVIIQIKPNEYMTEVINKYINKSGDFRATNMYLYNGKRIIQSLTAAELGIVDGSEIHVVNQNNVIGAI